MLYDFNFNDPVLFGPCSDETCNLSTQALGYWSSSCSSGPMSPSAKGWQRQECTNKAPCLAPRSRAIIKPVKSVFLEVELGQKK